jgi:hypothetical protein
MERGVFLNGTPSLAHHEWHTIDRQAIDWGFR